MLDKNAVGRDQAVIVGRWVPAELFFEGGYGFVIALDRGDTGQGADQLLDTVDQPLRRVEAGLYVDDQEGLAHGLLRGDGSDRGDRGCKIFWRVSLASSRAGSCKA